MLLTGKYATYVAAGILGILGGWLGRKAIAARSSVMLSLLLCLFAIAGGLATIGMTCYSIYLESKPSPYYTPPWYTWLIFALMIIQRMLFVLVGSLLVKTLLEAKADMKA